jgi:hypothetical protein
VTAEALVDRGGSRPHGFTHRRSSFDLHRGINPPLAPGGSRAPARPGPARAAACARRRACGIGGASREMTTSLRPDGGAQTARRSGQGLSARGRDGPRPAPGRDRRTRRGASRARASIVSRLRPSDAKRQSTRGLTGAIRSSAIPIPASSSPGSSSAASSETHATGRSVASRHWTMRVIFPYLTGADTTTTGAHALTTGRSARHA